MNITSETQDKSTLLQERVRMSKPHIVVIPYPALGHVIPLLNLSCILAKHGIKITFINTGCNHDLVKNVNKLDGHIKVASLSEDRTSSEAVLRVLPIKVEKLIEEITASDSDEISCILADQSIGWALELAEKKGIRRAAFCPAAAAMLALGISIPQLVEDGIIENDGTPTKQQLIKLSPTMPEMSTANFVWTCLGNKDSQKTIFELMVRNNKTLKLTEWLLCNSTYDLEHAALNFAPQIIPIGPVLAINKLEPEASDLLKWLDQNQPRSVIYIAFGSTSVLSPAQIKELALALEQTNRSFLWVVGSEMNDIFIKDFRNRIGNQGKIMCWAPQQRVLAHSSVGCFVSHCGWNSIIEGVSNGMLFLCWPYFADQFLNRNYICDIWKIGLSLNEDETGLVTRDEIRSKVEQVFSNGEFRARALEFKERVTDSMKEGGGSSKNFRNFVEWVQ